MRFLSIGLAFNLLCIHYAIGVVIRVPHPPSITKPPRPSKTSSSSSSSSRCDYTRCEDYINGCGMPYGGCFLDPFCGGTIPTFSIPLCTNTITNVPSGCPFMDCTYVSNPCGASIHTCFLASACGGTVPGPRTSTCGSSESSSSWDYTTSDIGTTSPTTTKTTLISIPEPTEV